MSFTGNLVEINVSVKISLMNVVNDNITMNRKWKIKMYKNDH